MPRRLFGFLAELLFTLSALVLLFLVYQLWFTTEVAKSQHSEIAREFQSFISEVKPEQPELKPEPVFSMIESQSVQGVGLLYIPRLRSEVWAMPVVSGTDDSSLAKGVGHYLSSELPGEVGNFAIAGHRATNGEPFAYFEKLREGDKVYLQTANGWFSYRLLQNQKIQDSEVWVLGDDPIGLGEQRLITLTTCDPRWNSTQRWAWWGVQVDFSTSAPAEVQ